jgi:murein DD-endopeptidase MepM/ murein hydrolase activator NlpD
VAGKKITIVCLPDGSKKVRQFKVSKAFLLFLLLFCFSAAISLAWVVRDYQTIKAKVPRLLRLEKENAQQRVQLIAMVQKIDQINKKMSELKEFDRKLKVMVNLEPDEENPQVLGIGGSDPEGTSPDYSNEKDQKKLALMVHQSLDDLDAEISIRENEKVELYKFLEDQRSLLASTPSIWPTRGWVSSRFGYRISPFTNEKEFHKGLDISTRVDSPIVAPADGVVSSVAWDNGYGKVLSINHGHGLKTRYAHLSKILVKKGEFIKRGQVIAQVGNSGRSTGPHLHYEVYLNGLAMNPLRYILN